MKPNEIDLTEINKVAKLIHESDFDQKTINLMLSTVYYMGANTGFDRAFKIIEQKY